MGWAVSVSAQPDDLPGYPSFKMYTPEDYGQRLQSQNWSVTQDSAGVIYVANPGGVLVYDSATWRLIPTARETLVRTVVAGPSGTVYAGAYGEIGALRPDSTGLRYASLLDEVDAEHRSFGHVWSGASTSEAVYFQTHDVLFRWDGSSMTSWPASDSTRFRKVFVVRDTAYVAESGAGLKRVVDGTLEMMPGSERFADMEIYGLVPHREGFIVGTGAQGLYRYANGQVSRFETEAHSFLQNNELYDGTMLPDDTYAWATLRGGVLVMDAEGRPRRVLDEEAGLISNDVKSLFVDRQGGLWMACEMGLARAEVASPISFYDDRMGLDGAALVAERHEGAMHIGTSAGVFRLDEQRTTDGTVRPAFTQVGNLRGQTFDLASTPDGLLAATEKGVHQIQGDAAVPIEEGRTAFALHPSRHSDALVYVGYTNGVGSLLRGDNQWTPGPSLDGFDEEIYFLEESDEGALWAASAYSGLWRIDEPGDLGGNPPVEEMASEEQTPRHVFRMTYLPDGLRIVTRTGLARPQVDETDRVELQPDSTLMALLPDDARLLDMQAAPDGDRWAFTDQGIVRFQPSDGGFDVSRPLARVKDFGAFSAHAEAEGTFWVVGEEGVLRHRPLPHPIPEPSLRTLIRRVATVDSDSVIYGGSPGAQAQSIERELAASIEALRFEFAAPGFGNEGDNKYRYRLVGLNDEWSSWTDETRKDYTNLPPGNYTFEVEARHPDVWQAEPASYRFKMLPPWYRTTWAYLLYGLLSIGLIGGLVWWRSAHLEARARRLEQVVSERTAEVQTQAQKLEEYNRELQQSNEALHEALEQKSELLGVAAHDLKNPLFGIRGLSEILLEDADLDDSAHRKVELIHDSAEETLQLINDLLESTAASSGQVQLDMEPLDMGSLADWVAHRYEPLAEKKDQELAFSTEGGDLTVEADEQKLREVMSNLVSNAVKYSPHGGRIDVEVERNGTEVLFRVRDEGPGLSEEEQKNLFAPFQRLSPEPTGGEASSGLGLYIVKQLVDLHDGRVGVESAPGEGSTFMVALPKMDGN